jgi:integrase
VEKGLSARKAATVGAGRHADGGGLYLEVKPSGARSWILRGVVGRRRRDIGLGGYPETSLAEARDQAAKVRAIIREGRDPIAERARENARRLTFEQAAKALIDAKKHEWKNGKHAKQWPSTLETYAYPVLGPLDVRDIEAEHVLKVLRPIWTEKPETASRLRQRIEAVLDYATATKARAGDNPARWRGNLDKVLAKPSKVRRVEHHAALPWREMGGFMTALARQEGMGALALGFTILTAARSGEVRGATWREIDMDAKVWTVPAARMKAEREHRIPLSDAALQVLRRVEPLAADDPDAPVFPGGRGRPLSDMTLAAVVKRMHEADKARGGKGYVDPERDNQVVTPHGFRSTFRDWVSEATSYPGEIAEAALAHTIRNAVEAAYRRGDLFEKRRKLMDQWAEHCATPAPAGEVVPINRASGA